MTRAHPTRAQKPDASGSLDATVALRQLVAYGPQAPSISEKADLVRMLREQSLEAGVAADRTLLGEGARLHAVVEHLGRTHEELREILEAQRDTPWYPATFLGYVTAGSRQGAAVGIGGARQVVALADDIEPGSLAVGEQVFLGPQRSLLVGRSGDFTLSHGQLATFDRRLSEDRAIVRYRDEEVVVQVAESLRAATLSQGDTIRWDRETWMALEKVDRSDGRHLFLEDTPEESFDRIGGLEHQIRRLLRSLDLRILAREIVLKYQLTPLRSVLLVGPPGTGKTMIARALANYLAGKSSSGRARFINVKPSGLHSMWYGQSEAAYRECFRAAREAGDEDPTTPAVIFLDEVDSVGVVRGNGVTRVNDQVLASLLAELDGLEDRGNVLVVAATNRLDALDPALLRPGRLGGLILEIPRPNRSGAEAILAKHLPPDVPYASGETDAALARAELIRAAVSHMYAETGDSLLARLTFRDGTERPVRIRDLVSGARLANLAREALESACAREAETGVSGLGPDDLFEAIHGEFHRAASSLTPVNCRGHIWDLPQDLDVVRVEAVGRYPVHRYLRPA